MDTKVVKLAFQAPVHFGAGRLSGGVPTCDAATLFSALYIEALRMDMQDELLAAAQSGALALSDAFPYAGDTYYLPKPMVVRDAHDEQSVLSAQDDARARKASKKLEFVSAECYADCLRGVLDSVRELERFCIGRSFVQTKVNLTRSAKNDADPYHVGGFSFEPGAGLYIIVKGSFDLTPFLDQLRFSGIGGKRSVGFGRFDYRIEEVDPTADIRIAPDACSRCVLLSSAAPTSDELQDELLEGAHYRLARKGGFVQSSTHSDTFKKKRDMFLFVAGSTFSRTFSGDVFDVNDTPGAHPVYRYAKAMWLEV